MHQLIPPCFLLGCAIAASAQTPLIGQGGDLDPRFAPDQRLDADTALGTFSVGVSGITESERRQATTGDIELGYLYQYEIDADFPRVAELRPFLFNRVESSDVALYESLGIGVGVRATLRGKHEQNNWFVRVSMLTPTDYYRERYRLDREQSSIVEVFAGFEVPIGAEPIDRAMRQRVTGPSIVRLVVSPGLFGLTDAPPAASMDLLHALMIGAYLGQVAALSGDRAAAGQGPVDPWPVLTLIERVTDERLTEAQWAELRADVIAEPAERANRRRAIVTGLLRRGLTQMMRGPYPLVFERAKARPGQGDLASASAEFVARVSRPGMGPPGSTDPLDADTMIEHYIAYVVDRIE